MDGKTPRGSGLLGLLLGLASNQGSVLFYYQRMDDPETGENLRRVISGVMDDLELLGTKMVCCVRPMHHAQATRESEVGRVLEKNRPRQCRPSIDRLHGFPRRGRGPFKTGKELDAVALGPWRWWSLFAGDYALTSFAQTISSFPCTTADIECMRWP